MSNARSARPSVSMTIGMSWLTSPPPGKVHPLGCAHDTQPIGCARGGAVEVTREVVVPAPPEEVWQALTEAERLEEWFANEVELDVRPGGAGRFRWDDGDERYAGVREGEPGERLLPPPGDQGPGALTPAG